jgi:signal transduction histidine kinase
LRVTDDGIGFEADRGAAVYGGHFGLLDMSERAEKIGGAFSLISAPGQGTEIRVEVAEKEGAVLAASADAEHPQEVSAA